jgi:hypothetical protein
MVKPFGEIKHGKYVLKYLELTDALRNRHFLMRTATNNKIAEV